MESRRIAMVVSATALLVAGAILLYLRSGQTGPHRTALPAPASSQGRPIEPAEQEPESTVNSDKRVHLAEPSRDLPAEAASGVPKPIGRFGPAPKKPPRIPCRGEGIPPATVLLRDPGFNVEAAILSDSDEQRLQSVIDFENECLVSAAAMARDARDRYLDNLLQSPSSVVDPGSTVRGTGRSGHTKSTYKTRADGRMEVHSAAAHEGDDPNLDAAEDTYKTMWESSTAAVIAAYLDIAKAK